MRIHPPVLTRLPVLYARALFYSLTPSSLYVRISSPVCIPSYTCLCSVQIHRPALLCTHQRSVLIYARSYTPALIPYTLHYAPALLNTRSYAPTSALCSVLIYRKYICSPTSLEKLKLCNSILITQTPKTR